MCRVYRIVDMDGYIREKPHLQLSALQEAENRSREILLRHAIRSNKMSIANDLAEFIENVELDDSFHQMRGRVRHTEQLAQKKANVEHELEAHRAEEHHACSICLRNILGAFGEHSTPLLNLIHYVAAQSQL